MMVWDDFLLATRIYTATQPTGLVNGPYGVWFLEYYKFKNGSSDLIYDLLRKKMNRMTRLFNDSNSFSYSLGFGLVGFLWAMRCMVPDREIYHRIILKETLIPVIEDECRQMIELGNYDLLTGAHGLLMYLISVDALSPELYSFYVKATSDRISSNGSEDVSADEDGEGPDFPSLIYEGISEIFLMLSRLYAARPSTACRKLLQKLAPDFRKGETDLTQYNANRSVDMPRDEYAKRLVRGYALVRAGSVLGNPIFIESGIKALEPCCTFPGDLSDDLSICSGSSMIAYMFHHLWGMTQKHAFKDLRNQWMGRMEKQWQGSVMNRLKGTRSDSDLIFSITRGFAGPRLAFMTMRGQINHQWDEWLLL